MDEAEVELEGVVSRVRYEADDGAFQVLVVDHGDGRHSTVVIRDAGLERGERVRLTGVRRRHRSGELQIEARSWERVMPSTPEGIETWLGSGAIDGIGPELARRIVDVFGEQTLAILDDVPERLREVEGIGPKRFTQIRDSWQRHSAERSVKLFLQSHGVSATWAAKIWATYGGRAVRVVRDDPWQLARDVRGIGFRTADQIARGLGFDANDPRRLVAGVDYVLRRAGDEGHVRLARTALVARACEALGAATDAVDGAVDGLVARQRAVLEPDSVGTVQVYARAAFDTEVELARGIARIVAEGRPGPGAARVEQAEQALPFTLAPTQRQALHRLVDAAVGVLTGGPGTGKTTIVQCVVDSARRAAHRVMLAAPTGRASRRLEESAGHPASTLHRLLEVDPRSGTFGRNRERPLEVDLVVVDEASMLDMDLAAALVDAIPDGGRVLLVGDVDQLPPVGAGDVLRDLITSGTVPVARLDRVFRQAAGSKIVDLAHAMRRGELVDGDRGADGEVFFVATQSPEATVEAVERVVVDRMPSAFGLDPVRDVQVLVPMHGGPVGTRALNERLAARLGRDGPAVTRGASAWRVGDKVMQVRNDYTRDTFNGDIGFVRAIDTATGEVRVRFDDRDVSYDGEALRYLEPAWAITVHKSQGSEFAAVVVVVTTHHFKLLQRHLVYTAVTRARQRLVVVGMTRAVQMALDNVSGIARHTGLATRLQQRLDPAT